MKLTKPTTDCAMIALVMSMLPGVAHAQGASSGSATAAPTAAPSTPAGTQGETAAEGSSDAADTGDIIVTAQKREQRPNDVGLTIAAVSGDALKASGITNPVDLSKVSSGFNVGATTSGFQVFSIRGINFNANQMSASPTVSAYIDETPLPYAAMWGGLLLDVDHVEVLKGPQGTLFGQNATGGSINAIAAKPTSTFHAGFQASVDHFGGVEAQGYVSGPLSDSLRVRLAASTEQFGAWQRGYVNNDYKNGDRNQIAGRMLVDWTPTSTLSFLLNVNGNQAKGEPQAYQFFAYRPQNPAGALPAFANFPQPNDARDADRDNATPNFLDNWTWQAALRSEWRFTENARLTSITNYVETQFRNRLDFDGTSIPGLTIESIGRSKTFTQELRLSGEIPNANINYIVGGYYQHDDLLDEEPIETYYAYSSIAPGTILNFRYPQTNRAYAAFANADLEIVPGLTLTGGARYTATKQTIRGCTGGNEGVAPIFEFISNLLRGSPAPAGAFAPSKCLTIDDVTPGTNFLPGSIDASQKEDNVSWRAGINYKVNRDTLLYVLASRGYKGGVFNVGNRFQISGNINPVKQEELTAYEIGIKTALLDRRIRLNLSAFHYDYKDKQFYTFRPNPPLGATDALVNIPNSKVDGGDAELTIDPVEGLRLHGTVTYIDTRVGKFSGYDIGVNPVDFTGNNFNYAPDWSSTFDATYRHDLGGDIRGLISVDGQYNAATNADLSQDPGLAIPAYTVLNARLGVESGKGWRAQLWVRNFTDKYYWTNAIAPGDWAARLTGRPRTFGATFGVDF